MPLADGEFPTLADVDDKNSLFLTMAMRDRGGDGAEKDATPPDIKTVTAMDSLSGLSCIFHGVWWWCCLLGSGNF
jgi:hypothetical protein